MWLTNSHAGGKVPLQPKEYCRMTDRADRLLVDLGHFESRASARAAIEAGCVTANGKLVTKPSMPLSADAKIEATLAHPWVSRGGLKLIHALDAFGISPEGLRCLDVGASTGGFTDVLLSRGAAHVIAVDVGRGQLHHKLTGDPRVTSLEATDARDLTPDILGSSPDLIVCDASFISLEKLLGVPLSLAVEGGQLVTLFKPQFQVGRQHVGKGGIVSNKTAATRAETAFCEWLNGQSWRVKRQIDSPIKGGDGNAERLVWAVKS